MNLTPGTSVDQSSESLHLQSSVVHPQSQSMAYESPMIRHASPTASTSRSPPDSQSDQPLKKKRRRRRSAITGTLYYPGEEPDPDAHLDVAKIASDDERRKNKGLDKKFPCDWAGCDKVFSRPDHLSRHRLNHEPEKIYTCDRCAKIFVRADLLARHAERHDRREQAQTNRSHGAQSVVTQVNGSMPTSHHPASALSRNTSAHLSNLVLPNTDTPVSPISTTPFGPSPTFNDATSALGSPAFSANCHVRTNSTDSMNLTPAGPSSYRGRPPSGVDFVPVPPPMGGAPMPGAGHTSTLPAMFGGTAMSLDAPFFSGQDFQWLFDGSMGEGWSDTMSWNRIGSPASRNNNSVVNGVSAVNSGFMPPLQNGGALIDPIFQQHQYGIPQSTTVYGTSPASGTTPSPNISHADAQQRGQVSGLGTMQPAAPPLKTPTTLSSGPMTQLIVLEDESAVVSAATRLKIIDTIKEVPELAANPRFTIEALGRCLEMYWANVHSSSFPILHRPTFRTSEAYVPLLCAMISLGGYFMDPDIHEVASAIHEDIRKQIISSSEFRPRASLDIIQTTLLVILYGKLCSTRYHHEMAHIFWGSTLTMYRRSALFAPRGTQVPQELRNDPDAKWRAWIQDESAKRAAYTAFLIDVQHAAIFRHAPTLSAFQLQHVLPADEEEWMAPAAVEWQRIHSRTRPGAPFMSALKASLMPGLAPPFLNPFSRVVILHGLISVAFDMQWRDVFMLGLAAPDGPVKDWRETISAAFNAWKSRLDSCLMSSPMPAHQLLRASISLYALAHIVLSIDVHELQIYAGAQKALGLVVAQHVIESTRERVSRWALSKDGRASTWHAAHFLRSSLLHLNQSNDLLHCLHYTWACYISVLTVYAYGRALSGVPPPYEASNHVGTIEAAMGYLDALCTQSPDNLPMVSTKHHSLPLIAAIYDVIKNSRWEIALEGGRILLRLLRSTSA